MKLELSPETLCVLVGNGPSVLRCNGAEIDEHDEIVRFNRFRIAGFEEHTGKRTTLWSTFGHGYLPGDEEERPKRVIFVYGDRGAPAYEADEVYRIPMSFYRSIKKRVHDHSKRTGEALERTGMTSGMVVAAWLLEVVGLRRLSLAGFDHFSKQHSRLHHYYNPKAYGRPPELDGDAEAAIFAEWEKQGRINYLTQKSMTQEVNWLFNEGDGPKSRHIVRLNRAEAELLWEFAARARTRMVEIGRCHGGSACLMSAAAPGVMLDSFDIKLKLHEKCIEFLKGRKVALRLANSQTVAHTERYDVAFIDGDHSYGGVKADFENLAPYLLPRALVLFHDAAAGGYGTHTGVLQFTNELIQSGRARRLAVADSMLAVEVLSS